MEDKNKYTPRQKMSYIASESELERQLKYADLLKKSSSLGVL